MKISCLFPSSLSRVLLAVCALGAFGGQAVAEPVAASAASAASAPASAPADTSASVVPVAPVAASGPAPAYMARYRGRFASGCEQLNEGLFSIDSVELSPAAGPVVNAQYRKALYASPRCSAAALLVTLSLPPATWTFDGQASVNGKTVERVTVNGQAGKISGQIAQPSKVDESADRFTVAFGQTGIIPIGKGMDAAHHKGLRLLEKGRLYQGNDEPLGADGYPAQLNMSGPYPAQKAPKARR